MKRKIIRQGHNTLTVTLPVDWVKKLNLKAGDELDVVQNNGTLTVSANQNEEHRPVELDISGLSVPMIWRFFQGIYREGYDEVKVIYPFDKNQLEGAYDFYASQFDYSRMGEKPNKKPILDVVQELVNRFVGMEIIDNGEDFCIVKEMGELTAKEFDNSLRRIFLLILEQFDKLAYIIKNNKVGDINVCKTIHAMDVNIDRFIDYCCRINNRIKDSSFQKNKPIMFSTLFLLELLGDEFKYIGRHLAQSKKQISEVLPFLDVVKSHFETYYKFFYKFDKETVIQFGQNDFKIYNEHFNWKESKNKDARSIRRHIMQISKFIFCLAELRIEMEY